MLLDPEVLKKLEAKNIEYLNLDETFLKCSKDFQKESLQYINNTMKSKAFLDKNKITMQLDNKEKV